VFVEFATAAGYAAAIAANPYDAKGGCFWLEKRIPRSERLARGFNDYF